MGSSGSAPNLPEPPIRLGIVLVGDDHPRKCTGRRLVRLGVAREVRLPLSASERPVVLDPYAPTALTRADLPRAVAGGLLAVDCSWNRLAARRARGLPWELVLPRAAGRRLPILVAGNPQHFGRLGELNTAEALAAALVVLGRAGEGRRLLSGFAGGAAFLELNSARFVRYAAATSPAALAREERALFGAP